MSQPPGQQPPQGEFGAPYGPPPESFPPPGQGTAQPSGPYAAPAQPGPYTPPAQPGPYAPPAQPAPGYGYPPQPAPGYGYPAQPGPHAQPTQPGYGFPAQQPPPQPPRPGGSGGGRFRGGTRTIVGAVLAVALLAGGGIWFALDGDGGSGKPTAGPAHSSGQPDTSPSPSPTVSKGGDEDLISPAEETAAVNAKRKPGEARMLWLQKGGVDLPQGGEDVYGPWFSGDTVVTAVYRTVTGYDIKDGSRKWSLRLSTTACAAPSQPTADGKIVLGVKRTTAGDSECNGLQMVDLDTGKAGWHKTYVRQGIWDGLSDLRMSTNGDTVTVGRTSRSDAFRVSDGKAVFGKLPGNCQPFGFASGDMAIAAASCQTAADDHKEHQVQRIDPATGKRLWTYKVKKGWQVAQIYSADPIVVSLEQSQKWAILVLNADGTYRTQLSGGPGDYQVACDADLIVKGPNLDNCLGVAADANTFYMATKAVDLKVGDGNKVAAFDLNTGKYKWSVRSPAEQSLTPLRTEGGKLLMYLGAAKNKGGGIASVPSTGGSWGMVLRHPVSGVPTERGFSLSRITYVGGRSYLTQARISGIEDGDEIEERSMVAFGS
ncbi:putative pyrroloquinoline-quinone binding quinoprotein [Streptomyces sp. 840.1]|uniref:outer membrane protein assembly factor BamB family protein n=1 Tax=Streptomyces sp. 840.1 TaxID=2485152 RepID=UPI000F46B61E|nr:PQQ-binding-like beta-propeller repeat protein [Streptomyces sp. 840.1]ROQ68416.1 putative pyrroloquinoline-quinone binding quinoprotein [Streptomyces sp. 840.1]